MKNTKFFVTVWVVLLLTAYLLGVSLSVVSSPVSASTGEQLIKSGKVKVLLKGNTSYSVSFGDDSFSRELPQRHKIKLRYQTFDPVNDAPTKPIPTQLKSQITGDYDPYIVQFFTQALEEYQKEIKRVGGKVHTSIPDQALIVRMSSATRMIVEKLPFVRWVGPFHPAYKLEDGLVDLVITGDTTPIRYSILVFEKGMQQAVFDKIEQIGGTVNGKGMSRRMEATLDSSQLQQIVQMHEILYIDRWTPITDDIDGVRRASGADYLETVAGYTGQGVGGEALDRGFLITHEDFQANPLIVVSPDHNPSDMNHGTEIAGILFGSGASDPRARGILPDAARPMVASRFSLWGGSGGWPSAVERYSHAQELVDPTGPYRCVFQTMSWGYSQTTDYTSVSAEMDELLFDLDLLATQSQSNEGNQNSRPEAWAKNIVGVGGIQNFDTLYRGDDCWCGAASIGPAQDGRIKPDLSHFYGYIYTTDDVSNSAHREFSGTSGATPATAGHFGLLFQMWADGVFDGGPGKNLDVFDNRPHASTAKALMIHSAYQYTFEGVEHDLTRVHQGWGMANVRNLYNMAKRNNWSLPILIDETDVITPLGVHSYSIDCDGSRHLKVTLVYADPPGVPGATQQRINDLSLKVTSPSGTIYWGNNGLLQGNWSTSGGNSNTIDTVENVFIKKPDEGTWTIEVLGDEIVQDGHVETSTIDADYALVATGGTVGQSSNLVGKNR